MVEFVEATRRTLGYYRTKLLAQDERGLGAALVVDRYWVERMRRGDPQDTRANFIDIVANMAHLADKEGREIDLVALMDLDRDDVDRSSTEAMLISDLHDWFVFQGEDWSYLQSAVQTHVGHLLPSAPSPR